MKRTGRRIVIVGGGSNAWTPNIVKDMLLTPGIADSTFVLYDIRREAAELVAAFLAKLNARLGTRATFVATDDRRRAFAGGDYFIITISTGGLDAMAHDLAIPEEYGIYHTVGDTSGPGGWARMLRNYPVFAGLARDINRYAPGAMVLNYTNPMAGLTDVLARACTGPVVGLCHGLFENLRFLAAHYGLASEADVSVNYGGVNHFFWTDRIQARGRDLLADLRAKVRRRGFTALLRETLRPTRWGSARTASWPPSCSTRPASCPTSATGTRPSSSPATSRTARPCAGSGSCARASTSGSARSASAIVACGAW